MLTAPQDESLLAALAKLGAVPGVDQNAQTYTVEFADGTVVPISLGATPAEFLDAAVAHDKNLQGDLAGQRALKAVADAEAAVAAAAEQEAFEKQALAVERSTAAALLPGYVEPAPVVEAVEAV